MTTLTWNGDPSILVYAARWALASGQAGSHAPLLVALTIRRNADRLPVGAKAALIRDICGWLDGRGITAPADARQPWCEALGALGVRRSPGIRVQLDDTPPTPVPIPAQRRRSDRLDAHVRTRPGVTA